VKVDLKTMEEDKTDKSPDMKVLEKSLHICRERYSRLEESYRNPKFDTLN